MLIIFDLDDTLIDTSTCLTSRKLEEALHVIIRNGLVIDNCDAALQSLLELYRAEDGSAAAIEAFLHKNNFSQEFLALGLAQLREELSPHRDPSLAVPYALDMLNSVKSRHRLAIVTIGSPPLQFSKLNKAGIDPAFFSKIDVVDGKNKKPSYQAIIDESQIPSDEVVVCGDRVAVDLVPAKELRCHTVLLARGRGRYTRESALASGAADFAIEDWRDFAALIEQLEQQYTHDKTLGRS